MVKVYMMEKTRKQEKQARILKEKRQDKTGKEAKVPKQKRREEKRRYSFFRGKVILKKNDLKKLALIKMKKL